MRKIHTTFAITLDPPASSFLIPLSKQAGVVFGGGRSIFGVSLDVKSGSLVFVLFPSSFGLAPTLGLDGVFRAILIRTNQCALTILITLRYKKWKEVWGRENTFRCREGYGYASDAGTDLTFARDEDHNGSQLMNCEVSR